MSADFVNAFAALKPLLASQVNRLAVKTDTAREYSLVTKSASPFPQHKGQPMWFGSVRIGKAYVSFHLMPLYMSPELNSAITPLLKKRMQGKTCFNFKGNPGPEVIAELERLTEACLEQWRKRKWL
jgi:hypothetical protein